MKDSLKEIILLGLGAVSLTGEKASERISGLRICSESGALFIGR